MAGNMTGRVFNNRYLVGERIGIGGMAEVYQGQDNVLGRTVAIKVMLPQYAEDATFTARFRQEAAAAANLQSPYIVNVYDWGQEADTSFIIMEFVRGSDLKTAIQQRGAINQRKVAEIGSQVCQALAVAHNLDIIHRDIKPQNIMVQPDGNVKVMDFGIARAKNSVMDKTDAVLGTAHYISPEQAQGKDLTAASDIYSLGVVLYEAATGQLPFDGPDAVSVALKQVNDMPTPPREVNPDIDPVLEAIILKAMSKNPRERFSTAREMRQALNDYLAGRQVRMGGFTGAQTAVMGGRVPDVTPMPAFQTEQTSVMPVEGGTGCVVATPVTVNSDIDKRQKKGSSKKGLFIALGVVAALAIVAALAFAIMGSGGSILSGGVEIPDFTGSTLEDAKAKVEESGLELGTVDYAYDDKVAANNVISQTPRAGSTQPRGTKVNLVVSQGIEQVEVPDLSDMTANEARNALQKAGLKYEAGKAEHSDTVAENHVLRQSPAAGTSVDKGSTVTYYLSAGVETVAVPDVVGSLEGEAQTKLTNAGFTVSVDYKSDNMVPEGQVISQSPKAGEKVKIKSAVSIVVSTGPVYFSASGYTSDTSAGSVSPGYTTVMQGGSITFYISPNDGYRISNVSDSNGNSYGATSSVTLNNVQGDVIVSATFEKIPEPTPSSSASAASTSATTQ